MDKFIYFAAAVVALASVMTGCSSTPQKTPELNQSNVYYDYLQPDFSRYLKVTEKWLEINRHFISDDHQRELDMNMPFQLSPETPTKKAILFVHGLGDSPFSFSDLAPTMVKLGFHVEVLLLPGHGSKPEELLLPEYQDWQTIVDHYASLLKKNYSEVWLGGFSTGANLVTIHAMDNGGINGMLLFSPGFQSKAPFLEKFTPLAAKVWYGYKTEENNLARYNSAPLNGAVAYVESAAQIRKRLAKQTVNIPTLIAMSEADSVVDPDATKQLFIDRFVNPENTMLWYGETRQSNPQVIQKTMRIKSDRISTGSHMSPVYSPDNPYYGISGEKRMCKNSFDKKAVAQCSEGEPVWFSAQGYKEEGKIHARLTWNPYFNHLEKRIEQLVSENTGKAAQ